MAIQLLGFPTTLGLPHKYHEYGPDALRRAGLVPMLEALGETVEDLGDLPLEPGTNAVPVVTRVQKVVEAARRQMECWLKNLRPGNLMMTLGGDHSTSLGTIWALSAMGRTFDVVWIDAHGDYNILHTSPSGNVHGMVLSLAVGLMPTFLHQLVGSECLHYWGIRSVDPGERVLLELSHATLANPDEVRRNKDALIDKLKPDVFLSFDIDSVDPSEAPGTRTPVPGGFTQAEALDLVDQLSRKRNLVALDIVEFHPDNDRNAQTLNLALAVARTAIANQLARRSEGETLDENHGCRPAPGADPGRLSHDVWGGRSARTAADAGK